MATPLINRIHIACLFTVAGLSLSACIPAAVGGATTAGVFVAQERSFGTAIDDSTIRTAITKRYLEKDVNDLLTGVGVEVHEGRVLLTGEVVKPETAIEAVKLAWQADGVKEVINEIQVTNRAGMKNFAQDAWITNQVKGRLVAEKGVASLNFSIETVNNVVYVMGIARSETELQKVLNVASRVKGVQRVVSHVVLKNDPRRG